MYPHILWKWILKSNNDNHLLAHLGLQKVIKSYDTNINKNILNTSTARAEPLETKSPYPTKSTAPGFKSFVTIAKQINHMIDIEMSVKVIIQLFKTLIRNNRDFFNKFFPSPTC